MTSIVDKDKVNREANVEVPQWKKDLIARLKLQNKCLMAPPAVTVPAARQLLHSHSADGPSSAAVVQESNQQTSKHPSFSSNKSCGGDHHTRTKKMVQAESLWNNCEVESCGGSSNGKISDEEDEDLSYGPGIVNKLKNKYLSLAFRENIIARPCIIPLRKATSLENILDDETPKERYKRSSDIVKNVSNRYRNATRGGDTKIRARSVETISRSTSDNTNLAAHLNDKTDGFTQEPHKITAKPAYTNGTAPVRPKRIAPLMNEREKPPIDVVKQAKMIFEKRPEQRTKAPFTTGEVAAKVANYKSIIVQNKHETKSVKKPLTKRKPPIHSKKPTIVEKREETKNDSPVCSTPKKIVALQSVPDVSMIDFATENGKETPKIQNKLSETPDLILTSNSFTRVQNNEEIQEEKEEIKAKNGFSHNGDDKTTTDSANQIIKFEKPPSSVDNSTFIIEQPIIISENHVLNVEKPAEKPVSIVDNSVFIVETPPLLIVETPVINMEKPLIVEKPNRPSIVISNKVLEKNLINASKNLQDSTSDNVNIVPKLPKKQPQPLQSSMSESNTMVFKFTDRKDVPDYVGNDRSRSAGKLERPKVGESGIIILSQELLDESFIDEEEEIRKWLEEPPSPCNVTFINDNVLIDGKSSFSQKSKTKKMRISFVDTDPNIFEYPSESSLLLEDIESSPQNLNHNNVPSLSGSSLANYTPKTMEDFQLGVTRSLPKLPMETSSGEMQEINQEDEDEPLVFSSGTNADILF